MRKFLTILLTLLWAVPAFATHPLITDDTGTQDRGKFQLEYNGEYSRDHEHKRGIIEKESGGTIAAALTYGVSDNIDIIIGLPWQ